MSMQDITWKWIENTMPFALSRRFSLSERGSRLLLITLGGIFVLVALVLLVIFAAAAFQLQHYVEGRCTITARQLLVERRSRGFVRLPQREQA
jgi:hypothetical protein